MKKRNQIIRAILMAQVASDAGKGITDYGIRLPRPDFIEARKSGYEGKPLYEYIAISLIRFSNPCDINYWVSEDLLVYFDIKYNGQRYQISFHNPSDDGEDYLRQFAGTGRKTRWTEIPDGSRIAAEELSKIFH